jgi:hypothetical protein
MAKKTICPVSRKEFLQHAKPMAVKIGDTPLTAAAREFSTGSLGWYLNGKIEIVIDGKPVTVQIGLNMTVVGSKELPKEGGAQPVPAQEQG